MAEHVLGPGELRITALGTGRPFPRLAQAGGQWSSRRELWFTDAVLAAGRTSASTTPALWPAGPACGRRPLPRHDPLRTARHERALTEDRGEVPICDIANEAGSMARELDLIAFADKHNPGDRPRAR